MSRAYKQTNTSIQPGRQRLLRNREEERRFLLGLKAEVPTARSMMGNKPENFAFIYRKGGQVTYCGDFKRDSPEQVKLGAKLFNVVGFPAPGDRLSFVESVDDVNGKRKYVQHEVTETELQAILIKAKEAEEGKSERERRRRQTRAFPSFSSGSH